MSKLPARRRTRSLLPDPAELFAGFPAWAGLRPFSDTQLIRLEDEIEDGHYVVRAELRTRSSQGCRHHRGRRSADDQGRAQ